MQIYRSFLAFSLSPTWEDFRLPVFPLSEMEHFIACILANAIAIFVEIDRKLKHPSQFLLIFLRWEKIKRPALPWDLYFPIPFRYFLKSAPSVSLHEPISPKSILDDMNFWVGSRIDRPVLFVCLLRANPFKCWFMLQILVRSLRGTSLAGVVDVRQPDASQTSPIFRPRPFSLFSARKSRADFSTSHFRRRSRKYRPYFAVRINKTGTILKRHVT